MNYEKIYFSLIEKRKNFPIDNTEYSEKHHILPRSLGGSDDSLNLVKLTAKEHYIAHLLLTKMFLPGSDEEYKMICAFRMMSVSSSKNKRYSSNSKSYEKFRIDWSNICKIRLKDKQKGELNSQFGKIWINNGSVSMKILKHSVIPDGWKLGRVKKIQPIKLCKTCNLQISNNRYTYCSRSCSNSDRTLSDLTKEKIRHNKLGKPRSEETKRKMSETIKNKNIKT